jgi:hypothetical protein
VVDDISEGEALLGKADALQRQTDALLNRMTVGIHSKDAWLALDRLQTAVRNLRDAGIYMLRDEEAHNEGG